MIFIVYSKATGRIRSIIYPDNASQIPNLLNGEAMEMFPEAQQSEFPDANFLQEQLNAITGLTPSGDRYAVVDAGGNVVGVMRADLLCGDSVAPPLQMIASDVAGIGWTWTQAGDFVAPPPVVQDPNLPSKE